MKIEDIIGKKSDRPSPRDERDGRLDGLEWQPRPREDENMERIGQ